jgi:hypothetical protein
MKNILLLIGVTLQAAFGAQALLQYSGHQQMWLPALWYHFGHSTIGVIPLPEHAHGSLYMRGESYYLHFSDHLQQNIPGAISGIASMTQTTLSKAIAARGGVGEYRAQKGILVASVVQPYGSLDSIGLPVQLLGGWRGANVQWLLRSTNLGEPQATWAIMHYRMGKTRVMAYGSLDGSRHFARIRTHATGWGRWQCEVGYFFVQRDAPKMSAPVRVKGRSTDLSMPWATRSRQILDVRHFYKIARGALLESHLKTEGGDTSVTERWSQTWSQRSTKWKFELGYDVKHAGELQGRGMLAWTHTQKFFSVQQRLYKTLELANSWSLEHKVRMQQGATSIVADVKSSAQGVRLNQHQAQVRVEATLWQKLEVRAGAKKLGTEDSYWEWMLLYGL